MVNSKPDLELIISDLLDMAYENAVAGKDTSVMLGAVILLREFQEKQDS
jgi:hypothetical protein